MVRPFIASWIRKMYYMVRIVVLWQQVSYQFDSPQTGKTKKGHVADFASVGQREMSTQVSPGIGTYVSAQWSQAIARDAKAKAISRWSRRNILEEYLVVI